MGLIALALGVANGTREFTIPLWVTVLCATALTLGVSSGGYRIIRKMGEKIYRLRPIHATAAQTASALVVLGSALAGAPVSTSQVVSSAIIGVGSADRMSGVRWQVASQIVGGWITTIPATALLAALVEKSAML
jgi:PiT family inorganic phosphate transporter